MTNEKSLRVALGLLGDAMNHGPSEPVFGLIAEARDTIESALRVEPTGDRYVGEPEHIPAPISGGRLVITGYDPSTCCAVIAEPKADALSCPTCKRPFETVGVKDLVGMGYFSHKSDCPRMSAAGDPPCTCGAENRRAEAT